MSAFLFLTSVFCTAASFVRAHTHLGLPPRVTARHGSMLQLIARRDWSYWRLVRLPNNAHLIHKQKGRHHHIPSPYKKCLLLNRLLRRCYICNIHDTWTVISYAKYETKPIGISVTMNPTFYFPLLMSKQHLVELSGSPRYIITLRKPNMWKF